MSQMSVGCSTCHVEYGSGVVPARYLENAANKGVHADDRGHVAQTGFARHHPASITHAPRSRSVGFSAIPHAAARISKWDARRGTSPDRSNTLAMLKSTAMSLAPESSLPKNCGSTAGAIAEILGPASSSRRIRSLTAKVEGVPSQISPVLPPHTASTCSAARTMISNIRRTWPPPQQALPGKLLEAPHLRWAESSE